MKRDGPVREKPTFLRRPVALHDADATHDEDDVALMNKPLALLPPSRRGNWEVRSSPRLPLLGLALLYGFQHPARFLRSGVFQGGDCSKDPKSLLLRLHLVQQAECMPQT